MRISLRQLEIFRAVALTGSTSAAAASMPLSQSATSAALIEFERTLGAVLFDRVGKRLRLNEAGRALLPLALAVLDGARQIETAFATGAAGVAHLRLAASTTIGNYLLPALLARHRAAYPEAQITLTIGNTRDVVAAVREFAADLGFVEGPCHAGDVVVEPWLSDELVIVASPQHPLAAAAARAPLTVAALAGASWLLREPGSGTREAVEQALAAHLPSLPAAMTLGSSEAIKNAAAAGLGVSCLSRYAIADQLAAGRLIELRTSLPPLRRQLALIHHQRKLLSAALRALIDTVRDGD